MRILVALSLVCLSGLSAGAAESAFSFFEPVTPPRAFQVMAHRGLAQQAPENTRRAIEMCIEDGLEWVALDLRLTKDGQHVLFSDANLEGKSNGKGPVNQLTLDELKLLDVGAWFAKRFTATRPLSLEECLALVKGKINLRLDCQDVDPGILVKQIGTAGMERQVLVSANLEVLSLVRKLSGGSVAIMPHWTPKDGLSGWLDELRPAVVEIDLGDVTPKICQDFHARGIKVLVRLLGSAGNPKVWDELIEVGVDFLQSDVPEEIIAHVLDKRLKPRPVRLACHRGASRYAPENTLAAFDKAYRLHADLVEFDVRPSSDGKFFLLHDGLLNRTTNGRGAINAASTATIESLDAGSWFGRQFIGTHVPSLDQFLSAVPEGVTLYFDAKDIPPEALAAAVGKHGLAERTVVYKGADYLEKLKQIDPRIHAMPPASPEAQVTALANSLKPFAVDTPWRVLSKSYIDHAHALGIQVFADAPFNTSVKNFVQAIEWGIDVIQTDDPLRVWRAMELVAAERAKR